MAIELNNRTKILTGVAVLLAAGAGAWFFFLADFLNEPPPPPKAVAAKAAPKPAADAPAQAAAATPAAAAKPPAKPIPRNPDQLIAEVVETSGHKTLFQAFAREVVLKADAEGPAAAEFKAVADILERVFEPASLTADLAANLKKNLDVERMGRFLEVLRQPIALKITSQETRSLSPEAVRDFLENFRKNPPSPARLKLIQSLDDVTRTSEVALEMSTAIGRSMADTMLAELQKVRKSVPKESLQAVGSQLNAMREQARGQIRSVLHATYRNATDEELGEYLKLLDTDTGRWGSEAMATALRTILAGRSSALGAEAGRLAMSTRSGVAAKAPAAPQPVAQPEEKPAEKPAADPVSAVLEEPGYRRPANIRQIYSRYNDLVSATVMRDRAAVKELLDDGKNPNVRQTDGYTPLMIAVSNDDAGIAAMLLSKGADPNARAGGHSALSIAKSRGSAGAGLVQLLGRSGAKE